MNQLGHEINIMKSYKIISNPRLPPSARTCPVCYGKEPYPSRRRKYEEYTHSPRFIKMLIEHPPLGFLHRGIIGRHYRNIQEILNQDIRTSWRHELAKRTVDLSSPCCLLSWAEPFTVKRVSFLRLYPHLWHHGRISSSRPHSCITLIAIPDALWWYRQARLPNPLTRLIRWSHWTSPSYILPFANGRRIHLEASWVV